MVSAAEIIVIIASYGSYVLLGFIIFYLWKAITFIESKEQKEKSVSEKLGELKKFKDKITSPFKKKEKKTEKEEDEKEQETAEDEALEETEEEIDEKHPEKISGEKISTFFDLLKINSDTKFKKDLEKEKELYNEFVELTKKKNTFVKNFLNVWNKIGASDFKKIQKEYKSLIDQNKEIIKILNKIIEEKNIMNSIFFKLVLEQEKNSEHLGKYEDKRKKEFILNIKRYIVRLNDELKFLKNYLLEENAYIKKHDVLESHEDLEENHGEFYRLIEGENVVFNNIKVHIINLLRFLKLIEKPNKKDSEKLYKLRIVPVRYNNIELRKFYRNIYQKTFKKGEEENLKNFQVGFDGHKEYPDDYAYHVLLAKIDNVVVGGIISEIIVHQIDDPEEDRKEKEMLKFYKDNFGVEIKNNKISFGVVWWVAVSEEKKLIAGVAKELLQAAYYGMEKEADSIGVKLSCIIAELNPTKKKELRFFRRFGIKECFKDYIQITSNKKFVEHLTLYLLPLIKEFKDSISRDDLLTIIEGLQVESNDLKVDYLKGFQAYKKMVKDILKKEQHKLK